jgi:hypothetical protein
VRRVASAASHRVALSSGARTELACWAFQLRREDQLAVPLASQSDFPLSGTHGLLEPYSDPSREDSRPEESGFGAWCVFGEPSAHGTSSDHVFGAWYVHGRWSAGECRLLSINVLELFAMQLGTLTFIDKARKLGLHVSHVREFTDNRAAELSAERGRPHTERMSLLIRERYEQLVEMKITPTAARIATEDNDVADGSRAVVASSSWTHCGSRQLAGCRCTSFRYPLAAGARRSCARRSSQSKLARREPR